MTLPQVGRALPKTNKQLAPTKNRKTVLLLEDNLKESATKIDHLHVIMFPHVLKQVLTFLHLLQKQNTSSIK